MIRRLADRPSVEKGHTAMKPLWTLASALVVLSLLSGAAAAQTGRAVVEKPPIQPTARCPLTFRQQAINVMAPPPAATTPVVTDFPASCGTAWEPDFGGSTVNRCFRQTFTWKPPGPQCTCLSGTLTLHYKALQGGAAGSSSSANDTVAIYSGGSVVPGTSQALYSGNVTTGQTGTKTIQVSCNILKNDRLSFLVQDDTSVTSASLQVVYCCSPCPQGEFEKTFPGSDLKYCCDGRPGAQRFCCTAKRGGIDPPPPPNPN
jgi:hypothetical protein